MLSKSKSKWESTMKVKLTEECTIEERYRAVAKLAENYVRATCLNCMHHGRPETFGGSPKNETSYKCDNCALGPLSEATKELKIHKTHLNLDTEKTKFKTENLWLSEAIEMLDYGHEITFTHEDKKGYEVSYGFDGVYLMRYSNCGGEPLMPAGMIAELCEPKWRVNFKPMLFEPACEWSKKYRCMMQRESIPEIKLSVNADGEIFILDGPRGNNGVREVTVTDLKAEDWVPVIEEWQKPQKSSGKIRK